MLKTRFKRTIVSKLVPIINFMFVIVFYIEIRNTQIPEAESCLDSFSVDKSFLTQLLWG